MKLVRLRSTMFKLGLLLLMLTACQKAKPEAIDATDLVGHWELSANDETEWFDLAEDGSFQATIRRDGFIATTLSQGPRVKVSGTWRLTDRTITFFLERSTEPALVGQSHSYEIIELTNRSLRTVNERGEKKTLLRDAGV